MTGKASYCLAAFVLAAAMTFSAAAAAPDFRPTISWIADQRITPGTTSTTLNFTIGDVDTPLTALTLSTTSSNTPLLPADASGIVLGGSGANRTIKLIPVAGQTGESTVTITVSDGTKTAATSFTLTVAATIISNTAPEIQGVPNGVIPYGVAYPSSGTFLLVINDNESVASTLTLSKQSSNTALVPTANIVFAGKNYARTVKVTPKSGQSGRATITLSVSDGVNTTSTSFVLDVLPATPANTPPTITPPANQIITLGTAESAANFTVGDGQTDAGDLQVWATSSNTALLPNEDIVFGGSGANRTVTLNPTTGATGAATVRVTVCDGDLSTEGSFLLVVHDPTSPAEHLQRPRGIYVLSSASAGTSYTTSFLKNVKLSDADICTESWVDGYEMFVHWSDVERSDSPGDPVTGDGYDFHIIQNILSKLPAGQKLSLILMFDGDGSANQPPDHYVPTYIMSPTYNPGLVKWTDANNVDHPVPWDAYLDQRVQALFQALAAYTINGVPLAQNPRLAVLNSFLPAGHTGICSIYDPTTVQLSSLTGYTREKLYATVQGELETLTSLFPGKFVQVGFWPLKDSNDKKYGNTTLWQWIYNQLVVEFNGVNRPHVGFFQENMGAASPGPGQPYISTPSTTEAAPLYEAQPKGDAWCSFQVLSSWYGPWLDSFVDHTLNGTPANGVEGVFNNYGAEYDEIHSGDLNYAPFQPELKMWHQFFATGATTDSAVGSARWATFR